MQKDREILRKVSETRKKKKGVLEELTYNQCNWNLVLVNKVTVIEIDSGQQSLR